VAESYFVNAKLYDEDVVPKETMLVAMLFIGKSSVKNAKETRVPLEDGGCGNTKP